jgi:very-short-patch-repair endonuclease
VAPERTSRLVYNSSDLVRGLGGTLAELQRFIWEWPSLLEILRDMNPTLGAMLARSTRPIEAERRPDGRLLLILGCWVAADREELNSSRVHETVERSMRQLLGEPIEVLVTEWPAGDGSPDNPPDPLVGLSDTLREIGATCGGALSRSFFAEAARRGIVFECQYPVLNYRLDFALPRWRIGVEIGGWGWRAWTRPGVVERREREQRLGAEGWTVLWFTGEEILHHLDRAVDEVARLVNQKRALRPAGGSPRVNGRSNWSEP